MNEIERLWSEHLAASFPDGYRGECINGHDAVVLDADIAGCVRTFLDSNGRLDEQKAVVLRRCQRVLDETIDTLDGYPREYYQRLKTLAELVLTETAGQVSL